LQINQLALTQAGFELFSNMHQCSRSDTVMNYRPSGCGRDTHCVQRSKTEHPLGPKKGRALPDVAYLLHGNFMRGGPESPVRRRAGQFKSLLKARISTQSQASLRLSAPMSVTAKFVKPTTNSRETVFSSDSLLHKTALCKPCLYK
jgi:hypothetical protein